MKRKKKKPAPAPQKKKSAPAKRKQQPQPRPQPKRKASPPAPAKRKAQPKRKAAPAQPKRKAAPAQPKRKAAPAPAKRKARSAPAPAPAPAPTVTAALSVIAHGRTQAQAAKALGVSVRTLQRYRKGESKPPAKVIKKAERKAAEKLKRAREGNRKRRAVIPSTKYDFQATRQTRYDPKDMQRKKRVDAKTILIDIDAAPVEYVAELVEKLQAKGVRAFRVVYMLPAGQTDYRKQKYDIDVHTSTNWAAFDSGDFDDPVGVFDWFENNVHGNHLFMVITDDKNSDPKGGKTKTKRKGKGKTKRKN